VDRGPPRRGESGGSSIIRRGTDQPGGTRRRLRRCSSFRARSRASRSSSGRREAELSTRIQRGTSASSDGLRVVRPSVLVCRRTRDPRASRWARADDARPTRELGQGHGGTPRRKRLGRGHAWSLSNCAHSCSCLCAILKAAMSTSDMDTRGRGSRREWWHLGSGPGPGVGHLQPRGRLNRPRRAGRRGRARSRAQAPRGPGWWAGCG
jgi:hypothetical protein